MRAEGDLREGRFTSSTVFTHIFPTWLMCIIVVYSVCYWPS